MADFDSSLPIRSEADGTDERLHVKLVDGTTSPAVNQVEVDSDNNLHTELHGNNPAGTDVVIQLSESGEANTDGYYDASNNSEPASTGLIGHDRQASPADTYQTKRLTAIDGASNSVCLDVAIHDESGNAFGGSNPVPVSIVETEGGTKVHDYQTSAAVAKDASVDLDYSVADGTTFTFRGWEASGSGKIKVVLKIGDGEVAEAFTTKGVQFNSTANPNLGSDFAKTPITVAGTVNTTTVRLSITNLDNQSQDVYATVYGVTV